MGGEAYDAFFREEHRRLVALGAAMTGSVALGEEVAQEALIRALQRWDEVERLDRPGAWVRRVLINLAIDGKRRRSREQTALDRMGLPAPLVPEDPVADAWWAAVRALPPRQRAMVALHYLEDRSIADVAALLDVAEGTVKASLAKARQTLAKALRVEDSA